MKKSQLHFYRLLYFKSHSGLFLYGVALTILLIKSVLHSQTPADAIEKSQLRINMF